MKDLSDLIAGFRRFQRRYFHDDRALFERLVRQGQSPRAMVAACCDARADPAIVMDCDPGDLFVVRNVANLVPPCEAGGGYHGTSAALEFAIRCLGVEHAIVMGHARCGGIRALLGEMRFGDDAGQFIAPWMSIADEARRDVLAAIRVSLRNLMSFPFVRSAIDAGRLALHGWYFDIEHGALLRYAEASGLFEPAA